MSTSVLNSAGAATTANTQTPSVDVQPSSPATTMTTYTSASSLSQGGPSTSSSSASPSSVLQMDSTTLTSSTGTSAMVSTVTGAPTSVVTVSHTASTSQQHQPSTSSADGLGQSSSTIPQTLSSQMQYVSENFIQPMIVAQTAAVHSHFIQQMASSSSTTQLLGTSSGSQQQEQSSQSSSSNNDELMKRAFESIICELDPSLKSYSPSTSTLSSSDYHHRLHCCVDGVCPSTSSSSSTLSMSSKRARLSRDIMQSPSDALSTKHKLEQRLNGILCCAVCLDLPKSAVYQCPNGHLMCAGCFTHVLADGRLRDESPTCPSCRISISKESCSRNLAVEKAVCELPGECRYCERELPRSMLEKHMNEVCEERIVPCRFSNIGCPWNGPFHEADYHANNCNHPNKSAREVLNHLEEQERKKRDQRRIYESMFSLLSFEKISFHDVQFRPFRTDEYIHKLFYETSRFTAFTLQWVIKARVNDDQRDPTQSCERHLSFQLCLKSKINNAMTIHYMLLKGPYGDTKVLPMIYKYDFSESQTESTYNTINLASTADSNRLLAARMINFRLIMFQANSNSK